MKEYPEKRPMFFNEGKETFVNPTIFDSGYIECLCLNCLHCGDCEVHSNMSDYAEENEITFITTSCPNWEEGLNE